MYAAGTCPCVCMHNVCTYVFAYLLYIYSTSMNVCYSFLYCYVCVYFIGGSEPAK